MCAEHCRQNGTLNHRSTASALSGQLCSKAYSVVRASSMRVKQKPPRHANPIVGIRLVRATFDEGSPRGVLRASCVVHVMQRLGFVHAAAHAQVNALLTRAENSTRAYILPEPADGPSAATGGNRRRSSMSLALLQRHESAQQERCHACVCARACGRACAI